MNAMTLHRLSLSLSLSLPSLAGAIVLGLSSLLAAPAARAATLQVTVLDRDGQPAPNVAVVIVPAQPPSCEPAFAASVPWFDQLHRSSGPKDESAFAPNIRSSMAFTKAAALDRNVAASPGLSFAIRSAIVRAKMRAFHGSSQ